MSKSKIVEDFKATTAEAEQGPLDNDEELIEDSYNSFVADIEEADFIETRRYLTAHGF